MASEFEGLISLSLTATNCRFRADQFDDFRYATGSEVCTQLMGGSVGMLSEAFVT